MQGMSKGMAKKQQMQWPPHGAYLLLQVHTQVLNKDWDDTFRKWYPNFQPVEDPFIAERLAARYPDFFHS